MAPLCDLLRAYNMDENCYLTVLSCDVWYFAKQSKQNRARPLHARHSVATRYAFNNFCSGSTNSCRQCSVTAYTVSSNSSIWSLTSFPFYCFLQFMYEWLRLLIISSIARCHKPMGLTDIVVLKRLTASQHTEQPRGVDDPWCWRPLPDSSTPMGLTDTVAPMWLTAPRDWNNPMGLTPHGVDTPWGWRG